MPAFLEQQTADASRLTLSEGATRTQDLRIEPLTGDRLGRSATGASESSEPPAPSREPRWYYRRS